MGSMITLKAEDGFELLGYLAEPDTTPKGGVVLVQEIFGITDHIKRVVDGYAQAGYTAIAPSYFDRVEPAVALPYTDIPKGLEYVGQLTDETTLLDTAAAAAAIKSAGKLGCVGYCWGGSVVYLAASRQADVFSCGVSYYGGRIGAYLESDTPSVPVLYHFGSEDHAIPMEIVDQVRPQDTATVHVYEGAGHGFNCDDRDDYDPEAAKLAFSRSLQFLGQHL